MHLPDEALFARRLIFALASFSALSALGGSLALLIWFRGNETFPTYLLRNTPFDTFLVPGFLLGGVVGASSLACAVLVWRRSSKAIDAALLAGGALTIWITAELGIMRELHWLHGLCGATGLAMLGLAVVAASRSSVPRHRWVVFVTAAESVGFLAPAVAGVWSTQAGLSELAQAATLVAAGLLEGLLLGAGQAQAFPLPLRRGRYAAFTAVGAALTWAIAMTAVRLAQMPELPPPTLLIPLGIVAAGIGLASIGTAQWLELRHHVRDAQRWIGWTAAAWIIALPLSFTPGPFVDETTPLLSHIALWLSGGVAMAYVMALVTWQGARRLLTSAQQK